MTIVARPNVDGLPPRIGRWPPFPFFCSAEERLRIVMAAKPMPPHRELVPLLVAARIDAARYRDYLEKWDDPTC